ncbi:MAG: hypothetical protein PHI23_04740, partial [Candidatus Peribacteraceae bacterium]|nr:hypothetical protein [Candidatus Peribacteraceae bacterium]
MPPSAPEQRNLDYDTLCRQAGIEIRIPGQQPGQFCSYFTTGAHTVLCGSTGKEYPLEISSWKRNGQTAPTVTIHHTDVDVWLHIPGSVVSQLTEANPTAVNTSFYDQATLPTRRQVFSDLHFYEGNPDAVRDTCKERDIFDILTQEYVERLGRYLTERIRKLGEGGQMSTVLEVGAGDGRLTDALREQLAKQGIDNVRMIAVDSNEWDIKPTAPVERMEYQEALQTYHPQIVLCSWMPSLSDWTEEFRGTPSVQEYILIGP